MDEVHLTIDLRQPREAQAEWFIQASDLAQLTELVPDSQRLKR
jgi:hypothetical protein